MSEILSGTTEELIQQYAYYLDGKIQLPPATVKALEEKLGKSSYKDVGAGKLLEIFNKCAEYPNLFTFDKSEKKVDVL